MFNPFDPKSAVDQSVAGCALSAFIARGATGIAYLAHHPASRRNVVVKFVDPETAPPARQKTILDDARAIASLNHANIAKVITSGIFGQHPFIVTEFVEGVSLQARLGRVVRVPSADAIYIAAQVAKALQAAAGRGVFHRNLKPSNVLLPKGGRPKLIDFGLLPPLMSVHPNAEGIAPNYMAPELWHGEAKADALSDQYSLGLLLYRMVLSRDAFRGSLEQLRVLHREKPVPSPKARPQDLSNDLVSIILKLTQKEPSLRYDSGDDLVADLEKVAVGDKPKASEDLSGAIVCPLCDTKNPRSREKCSGCNEPVARMSIKTEDLLPDDPAPPPKPLPRPQPRIRRRLR